MDMFQSKVCFLACVKCMYIQTYQLFLIVNMYDRCILILYYYEYECSYYYFYLFITIVIIVMI